MSGLLSLRTKHRSLGQEYEQDSRGKLLSKLDSYTVNELNQDFGVDFNVSMTESRTEQYADILPQDFYIQLKSSEGFRGDSVASFDLEVDEIVYLHQRHIPSLLVLYSRKKDRFYWQPIQQYVWDHLNKEGHDWLSQDNKVIHVPRKNTFDSLELVRDKIENVQSRIMRDRALEFGNGTIVMATEIIISEVSSAESFEPYETEIAELHEQASILQKEIISNKNEDKTDAIEMMKYLEKAVSLRERLKMINWSEPDLTPYEQNWSYTGRNCPQCNSSLSRVFSDSNEVSCSRCGYNGVIEDLKS